jgi:regulator of protease activity HflC (stomatin/prohibitin superfamily)
MYGLAAAAFVAAAAILMFDVYLMAEYRRRLTLASDEPLPIPRPIRWKLSAQLAAVALVFVLMAASIAVVPSGMAGVRVSQVSGTKPGTLYPGVHFVTPLVESVALYDVRDQLYTTSSDLTRKSLDKGTDKSADKTDRKTEPFVVQAKEGLPIGLAITIRYKLDARRLDFIHNTLPEPIESEVVPPVIGSVFRGIVPQYTVREVFSTHREHIREVAAQQITQKLASDGIVVKEVILREVQLPPEYAKGLENLLLKEQENDQLSVQTEIQQKQVRISELQAEAERVQEVKRAEGASQVRVLQAKGESDAMQYTLPLKQKQIEQSRLEAEARKESTIKNAEAAAEAKVLDSKAELQRRNLLADAEANRIRVTAVADAERMRSEAAVLKQTPLLINKIIAERLSDKVQIMMVPADGKYFFASDVLRGQMPQQMSEDDPPGESNQNAARTPYAMDGPNNPRFARRPK